jgi:hypothetical protein
MTLRLKEEYQQLVKDREELRYVIFKKYGDDNHHLPVNIPRIIWNAKE